LNNAKTLEEMKIE